MGSLRGEFHRFFDAYVFWLDYARRLTEDRPRWTISSITSRLRKALIGLLTGNIRLGAEIKLRHFYLWDYFRMGVFGDEDECRDKLAALALERGRSILGEDLSPEEIVIVGDTVFDIACAQSIGARSLAVCSGAYSNEELSACNPTWLVPNLNKIQVRTILG